MFALFMDFVPCKTFGRIVDRHRGDVGARTLSCTELFRIMAFAQRTWRESLRDIEACLTANQPKLFLLHLQNKPPSSAVQPSLALATSLVLELLALLRKEIYAPLVLALWGWAAFRGHRPQASAALQIEIQFPDRGMTVTASHVRAAQQCRTDLFALG